MTITSLPFSHVLEDVSSGNIKVPKSEYQPKGTYPVIDQGKSDVAGYTNDPEALFKSAELPVIVFGDHTRCVKFVDVPFAMGADGVKILKPKRGHDAKFLFHALHNLRLADAGYDRHFKYLKRSEFPIVEDTEEQKRIAAILDKADAIRRKRQQALRLTDDFLRSVFLDMFGDPVTNPKRWPLKPISEGIASFDGGKNVSPIEAERADGVRVLKVSAVTSGEFRANESKSFSEDFEVPQDYIVRQGDLLISRANTSELVGAVAYVWETDSTSMLPDKLWRFVWSEPRTLHPLFMLHMARSHHFRHELILRATGSSGSMKNIGKAKMLQIPIPTPPYGLQEKFAAIVTKLRATSDNLRASLSEAEANSASLQQRAFRGEL